MPRIKLYKIAMLSSAAFALSATPALADPVSIGTLVVSGVNALLGAGTLSATASVIGSITLAQVIGTTVLIGAQIGLGLLASGGSKGQGQADPTINKQTFETGNSGQWRCLGRAKIGGVVLFGNTKDFRRHRIIARCRGPIDAVEENFLGGRSVVVEDNGDVSSPPYARAGGSWVNIQNKVGDGTETAWADTVADFPGLWTVNHRARGIAQTRLLCISPGYQNGYYARLYGSGYPESQQIIRGELVYDPRDGGVRWTDNGVLCVQHILMTDWNEYYPTLANLLPSGSNNPIELDFPAIAVGANEADQNVATRTGIEKRSRFWGIWEEGTVTRNDLLLQALQSTGTELYVTDNQKVGIRCIDDNAPPEITFAQRNILRLQLKSGPESVERPNLCKVSYYSTERGYEVAEINLVQDIENPASSALPWARVQSEIDKRGEKPFDLKLPFCPSASQAQRIARRMFAEARAATGVMTTNMVGLATWGTKTIGIEDPDGGPDLIVKNSRTRIDMQEGKCETPFRVRPILPAYNPAIDEALAPQVVPDIGFTPAVPKPALATQVTSVTLYGSSQKEVRVAYAVPTAGLSVEAQYRVVNGASFGPWQSMTEYVVAPSLAYAADQANLEGQTIQFRSRYYNASDDVGEFSQLATFAVSAATGTPPAPTVTGTTNDGGLSPDNIVVTLPSVLNIVAVVKQGGIGTNGTSPSDADYSGTFAARPGDVLTYALPPRLSETIYTYTARAQASGGVNSALTSLTWTTPPPPNNGE